MSAPRIGMPRLTDLDRARAIGQLQAGVPQNQVAALFGVSPSTISKVKAKFHITGDVRDRPRSGRPKKTTPEEDRFLTLSALRNRRLSSTDLQSRFAGRYGRRLYHHIINIQPETGLFGPPSPCRPTIPVHEHYPTPTRDNF